MFPLNNLKGRNSSLENQSGRKRRRRPLTWPMKQGSADKPACSVGSLKLQKDADKVHVSPCFFMRVNINVCRMGGHGLEQTKISTTSSDASSDLCLPGYYAKL